MNANLMKKMAALLLLAAGCGGLAPDGGGLNADSLATCDPARAVGAVSKYERALLDTVATTEGTYRHDADDGYDVEFTYATFSDCTRHPAQVRCSGSLCSDAAGRYQFLSSTWAGLGFPAFYPNYQDEGAMRLIRTKRSVFVPTDRALSFNEFVAAMGSCNTSTGEGMALEWASLPPGCYGQPSVTMSRAWAIYNSFLAGAHGGGGTPASGVGVDAGNCTAAEQAAQSGSAPVFASYWTCEGSNRYMCDGKGHKVVESCPSGCAPSGQNTDDQCNGGGRVKCTAQEIQNQTDSRMAGLPSYWTCEGKSRYVCDGEGFKVTETCAHACVSGGADHDDQCE
jgi:muramidase (phage lysozyme)